MSNEAIIITLLSIIGFLVCGFVAYYIDSVEKKFQELKLAIEELKIVVGMRKMYGTIEHRINHQKGA